MTRRPLSGKVVVVTRPKAQAQALISALSKSGARVVAAPLIRVVPPSSFKKLDAALRSAHLYDGLLFTSRNAVKSFFSRSQTLRLNIRRPTRLYAVGPETAHALKDFGWSGAKQPKVHHGAALARALGKVRGLRLLIPRAKVAGEELPRLLRRKGASVTVAEAYRTVVDRSSSALLKKAALTRIDAVTFSSGSTVEQFVKIFGRARSRKLFKTTRAVSIGPVTSAALRRDGIKPAAQAKTATAAGLAKAVKDCLA